MKITKQQVVDFLCTIAGNKKESTLEFINEMIEKHYIDEELISDDKDFCNWLENKEINFHPDFTSKVWKKRDLEEEIEASIPGAPYGDEYEEIKYETTVKYSWLDQLDFICQEFDKSVMLVAAYMLINYDLYDFFKDHQSDWEEYLSEENRDDLVEEYIESEKEAAYWRNEATKPQSQL